jgi:hypothetical protein
MAARVQPPIDWPSPEDKMDTAITPSFAVRPSSFASFWAPEPARSFSSQEVAAFRSLLVATSASRAFDSDIPVSLRSSATSLIDGLIDVEYDLHPTCTVARRNIENGQNIFGIDRKAGLDFISPVPVRKRKRNEQLAFYEHIDMHR